MKELSGLAAVWAILGNSGIVHSILSEENHRQRMDNIGSSLRSRTLAENVEMRVCNNSCL